MRKFAEFTFCMVLALSLIGCKTTNYNSMGKENGPCYPNNTCNFGLTCFMDSCIPSTDGGSLDSSGKDIAVNDYVILDDKAKLDGKVPKLDSIVKNDIKQSDSKKTDANSNKTSSLKFDGVDDFVYVSDSASLDVKSAITIEYWIKMIAIASSTSKKAGVLAKWGDSSSWKDNRSYTTGIVEKKLSFSLSDKAHQTDGAYHPFITKADLVVLGKWVHIAFVFDGKKRSIYLDGKLKEEIQRAGTIFQGIAGISIGAAMGAPKTTRNYFNGYIDEIRIWNVARSSSQILDKMKKVLLGTETGLVAYWRFNEYSGQTAHDLTKNKNNGQLGGYAIVDKQDPKWSTDVPF